MVVKHWHFRCKKALQFLIKWKGYPNSDNSWESSSDVHAPRLVKDYWQRHKRNMKLASALTNPTWLPGAS